MNKHKVKHHQNSDTKTANRYHIRTTALERSVNNTLFICHEDPLIPHFYLWLNWGLKHFPLKHPSNGHSRSRGCLDVEPQTPKREVELKILTLGTVLHPQTRHIYFQ